ncbi:hypothetical protein HPB49_019390 [Dermacentor silvarum]|uniref:Uncharacterized protein n=1 Tax=Dermacentor silvarum TaxID=543639 RepID=A0ACB8CAV8_DERSI|nr:hypothetical protein HPB49_019390 [Dermacentor silvarum]
MAAAALPAVPEKLKSVLPYVKIATEHDSRDPIIAYWCRLYALQTGMKVDRSSSESRGFLMAYMDWLEKEKAKRKDEEAITSDVVAQAHIETRALKLFLWADGEDRAARFNKNVIKAFYTAAYLFDVLTTFGELTDEVSNHRKYARWKAAYIHRCLKNGEVPVPGPLKGEDEGFEEDAGAVGGNPSPSNGPTGAVGGSDGFPPLPPGFAVGGATASGFSEPGPSSARSSYDGVALNSEDFLKAQKYCKFAGSALQYEDVPTAIENLQKALRLLTTGSEGP